MSAPHSHEPHGCDSATFTEGTAAARALTSLDPIETKCEPIEGIDIDFKFSGNVEFSPEPASRFETIFRHSGWAARRAKIWKALLRTGTRQSNLERFHSCGSGMWVQIRDDGKEHRIVCNCCHHRFCIPCMREEARTIQSNLHELLAKERTRFITLTLRHSPTPLKDQIDRIFQSFNKLRQRQSWKSHVEGGAAFLEIKLSDRTGCFHVHLHILAVGSFWKSSDISAEWHAVTGDSYIVDVRDVKQSDEVARYVTKYVTKPADDSVLRDESKLDEFIIALRGRRLLTTFGTWRGKKLREKIKGEHEWKTIIRFEDVVRRSRIGDDEAIAILKLLSKRKDDSS